MSDETPSMERWSEILFASAVKVPDEWAWNYGHMQVPQRSDAVESSASLAA